MPKLLRLMTALAALGLLGACETAEGFGRDVQRAGQVITSAAN
ncbi:entericidin A/B family lipoprotein [Sulfitobacter sp. HNIBRBA3233]